MVLLYHKCGNNEQQQLNGSNLQEVSGQPDVDISVNSGETQVHLEVQAGGSPLIRLMYLPRLFGFGYRLSRRRYNSEGPNSEQAPLSHGRPGREAGRARHLRVQISNSGVAALTTCDSQDLQIRTRRG